nr:MAG TPA: hypothetical protein [Caudoviricetes sp.]
MYYLSRRDNETKIKVDEQYSNENTVVVEYLNGDKQGKTVSITHSTLKRWWKKIDTEGIFTKSENLENKTKKTTSKKKPTKIDRTEDIKKIVEMFVDDYEYKYYDSVKCYKIYDIMNQATVIAEVYLRRKNIEVRVRNVKENVKVNYRDGYKYYLPVHYYVPYETDYIKIIKVLLA